MLKAWIGSWKWSRVSVSFSLFLKVGHKKSTATDNLMPNKLGILGLRGIKDLQVKTEKECGVSV